MHHQVHKSLKAAYSFYNVSTVTPIIDLIQDALISAKNVSYYYYIYIYLFRWKCLFEDYFWTQCGNIWCTIDLFQLDFDVYNALDLMENKLFLEKLKFGAGDGNLQYYLYNWKCPDMPPNRVC